MKDDGNRPAWLTGVICAAASLALCLATFALVALFEGAISG